MFPENKEQIPSPQVAPKQSDPTKSSRSLAIALIVSAVLLLAAIGVVIWLATSRGGWFSSKNVTSVTAPDDTKTVKNVSLVPPATLPAIYAKNDQSTRDATNTYYYDDATNCGITVAIIPMPSGKSIKDVVSDAASAAFTQGVSTKNSVAGDKIDIKDADGKITYTFDSVVLTQDVKVDGVAFTSQINVIAYKQFGAQAASISYACKAETWDATKADLLAQVKEFTAKTER